MPLTLTVSEGVLPKGVEKVAFKRLSDAMMKWHGTTGNKFLTPNIVGSIHIVSPEHTFSGAEEKPVVFVEWKVPPFAFATREVQKGYIAEATAIVRELSGNRQPIENIYVNVVHAVEGAWAVAGEAFTSQDFAEHAARG